MRADLLDKCDFAHDLAPADGDFYAQASRPTSCFSRAPQRTRGTTQAVWFYDLRTNAPSFGKRTPPTRAHFADFERAFGDDPQWQEPLPSIKAKAGRFRKVHPRDIAAWRQPRHPRLKDESVTDHAELPEPDEITAEIITRLQNRPRRNASPVRRARRCRMTDRLPKVDNCASRRHW